MTKKEHTHTHTIHSYVHDFFSFIELSNGLCKTLPSILFYFIKKKRFQPTKFPSLLLSSSCGVLNRGGFFGLLSK